MNRHVRRTIIAAAAASALAVVLAAGAARRGEPSRASGPPASVAAGAALEFGDAFWKHWGDGKAELAGYDLAFPRYGEQRKGVAIAIFVTETFSNSLRVKSETPRPKSDEFPVMKLNLVEDFSTGIYDYNLLTSAWVSLAPVNGRPAGAATKVSFSSQEWCGHVYSQLLFDRGLARLASHSYFDGEADQARAIAVPDDALSGDAILLWARGLAAPRLAPGERREVPFVRSIEAARLGHRPVEMLRATLVRGGEVTRLVVPAGTFDVERRTVEIAGGPVWKLAVESAAPHRIVEWETSDGEKATLLGSDRLEYWKLHGEGQAAFLARLGLKARPPRTP
ncbi:MAG: hypothetical protein ABI592_01945 [Acidobacteriota bacterium]